MAAVIFSKFQPFMLLEKIRQIAEVKKDDDFTHG